MRAVDTNVVVRYLVGDDAKQTAKAPALIGQSPVFIPRTVLMEAEWVLRSVFGQKAAWISPMCYTSLLPHTARASQPSTSASPVPGHVQACR